MKKGRTILLQPGLSSRLDVKSNVAPNAALRLVGIGLRIDIMRKEMLGDFLRFFLSCRIKSFGRMLAIVRRNHRSNLRSSLVHDRKRIANLGQRIKRIDGSRSAPRVAFRHRNRTRNRTENGNHSCNLGHILSPVEWCELGFNTNRSNHFQFARQSFFT